MALAFSPATAGDVEELIALHTRTFPDARGHHARERYFTAHPLGALHDVWLARETNQGGALVAHAFLFPVEAWFAGVPLPAGAIASVGVAPEARRRGVATRMMTHLHHVAEGRGYAVTVLDPLRQGFYARLGYGVTTPYRRLRFAPAAVPFRAELHVRSATGKDRAALESCWRETASRVTGALSRSERTWDARLADERRTWLVAESEASRAAPEVEGYVAWTLFQREPNGVTTLLVDEFSARSDRAMRSLWAAVAAQGDQVAEIQVDAAEDDPLAIALVDASQGRPVSSDLVRRMGEVAGGAMVRVANPTRALTARGWPRSGTLVVGVEEQNLELSAREGRGVAKPTTKPADIEVDRPTLSSIAFGGVAPSQAARLGGVTTGSAAALAVADAMFSLSPYFSPGSF